MSLAEMELIHVPDAIEPYIGFKYLSWHDGKLWSSWGDEPWPTNRPFEAKCHGSRDYKWETTTGRPKPRYQSIDISGFGSPQMYLSNTQEEIPPPDIELPPGLSWSWEPQPVTHAAVDEGCSCGIYAVDTPEGCASYGPSRDNSVFIRNIDPGEKVLVELALWGKVIPGTSGVRGQFAYPQKILGSSQAAKDAAAAYGVPYVEGHKKDEKPAVYLSLDAAVDLSDAFMSISTNTSHKKRSKLWYAMLAATGANAGALAIQLAVLLAH